MFKKVLFAAGSVLFLPSLATASTLQLLSTFSTQRGGQDAQSDLVAGRNGVLYGTTTAGGTHGSGTAFELVPPSAAHPAWRRFTLFDFDENTVGFGPAGGALLLDKQGNLYGAISLQLNGNGQVFKLSRPTAGSPGWTFSTLYSFTGQADGAWPNASLIMDAAGNIYGTAKGGGTRNYGLTYELSPPAPGKTAWTQTVLYAFNTQFDGWNPLTGVVFDTTGNLVGTTANGGNINAQCSSGCGTVFRLIPPPPRQYTWTKQTLYQFSGGADGAIPESSVILDRKGVIYGTTTTGGGPGACPQTSGCGTVFSLAQSQGSFAETILHAFQAPSDGAFPLGHLVLDASGNLLGTTALGGATNQGTIFRLSPGGASSPETVLYDFANSTVAQPWSALLPIGAGRYLGTTSNGPAGSKCGGCGGIFEITP